MGIQLLLCDIDNTLVAYDEEVPSQDVIDFIHKLKMNGLVRFVQIHRFKG